MRYVVDIIVGLFTGGLVVVLFYLFILVLANLAFGDDSVSTRPATLGEQDRSLNYEYTPEDSTTITIITTIAPVSAADNNVEGCRANNERLMVSREYIGEYIKKWPKYAHFFDEALKVIEDTWCHDYD